MGKLLPIILIVLGGAIGGGAGVFLKPNPDSGCEDPMECDEAVVDPEMTEPAEDEDEKYYHSMKNQFVVPVIRDELVKSLVVVSLSLETTQDHTETLFSREPKLRDVLLQVLFDHAHIGGFNGAFTESSRLSVLKMALLEAIQSVVGSIVSDIVITDIVRQEI
jgi:hypothetical protein